MTQKDSKGLSYEMGQDSLPAVIGGADPLRGKREQFARWLAIGFPPIEAARAAGYPDDASSFADNARKWSHIKRVKDRVNHLRQNQDKEIWEEKRRIFEGRQFLWHEADLGEFYEIVEEPWLDRKGEVIRNATGDPIMRKREMPKPLSTLPRELRMCVESLTFTDSGKPNLKLYSKADANRELRKINGIDLAPFQDEGDPTSRLPDKEFFAELAKQASELGVNLKMTFEAMVE